jgi:hypothetical protein
LLLMCHSRRRSTRWNHNVCRCYKFYFAMLNSKWKRTLQGVFFCGNVCSPNRSICSCRPGARHRGGACCGSFSRLCTRATAQSGAADS